MELEYELAKLISMAKTDEQWRNALNAYGDTAWNLSPEEKERIDKMLADKSKDITKQNNDFYGLCFTLRKEHGFHNAIANSNILPLENTYVTADNVAMVAETLTIK